jgi:hypothetical protein
MQGLRFGLLGVWRILGGDKIRQTLCVLSLAKILNKKSSFIAAAPASPKLNAKAIQRRRGQKIFKR